jgi:protein-tyrosine phosphatase
MTTKTLQKLDKLNSIKNQISIFDLKKQDLKIKVYISTSPTQTSIEQYVEFMIREKITDVFNFSDKNIKKSLYDHSILESNDIKVNILYFNDGGNPPIEILKQFDQIIDSLIEKKNNINVLFHCLSGLGRAPTMFTYLMMTRFGYNNKLKRSEMITNIRKKRRYAFNASQLNWIYSIEIKNYDSGCKCSIM